MFHSLKSRFINFWAGPKRRARLNALTHILSKVPYEKLPREKIKLPKRQHRGDYKDPDYPFRVIAEVF